ncbi:hypothetical protein HMI56_006645 [Coelomomyces lativittatus]|nr:hypothetical protein HMI56_006645 [Coelomomyces lativittatus]
MEGVALPSQQHQEQKLQDLQAAHAYVFSEHDVDEMLELKQQLLGNAPRHLAAEKAKLVKQREIYLSAEQYSKAKEIESQLLILKQSTMEEDMKRQQASKRFTTTTNIAGVNRRPFYVHEEKKVSDMLPNPKDLLQEIDEAEYPENIESFQDLMSSVRWDLDFDL